MCITFLCGFQRAVLFPSICPRLPRRLDGGKSVPGWRQRGRQLVRDGVDARRCLRCEDARWYRGGLPGHPADCLRVTVPSANTYGSPAAAQCALQVSQRLRRSVSLCVWLYVCMHTNKWLAEVFLYSLHFSTFKCLIGFLCEMSNKKVILSCELLGECMVFHFFFFFWHRKCCCSIQHPSILCKATFNCCFSCTSFGISINQSIKSYLYSTLQRCTRCFPE